MKALITGRPGIGKSYVTQGLAARGLQAYDLEEIPGVIRLEVKETGEPAEWPDGFVDWNYYAWRIQAGPLRKFLDALNGDVYVSGSANNQTDFYGLFDKILVLTLDDPEVLRHRLETRNVHKHGQGPENIDRAVNRFLSKQTDLLALGGIAIDNSRPLNEVLDHIVEVTHDSQ
ncbi:MAG TPA: hypothetical protein VLE99_03445 [Candidatus Saccharimonadales bacterium]|nr:hypothetical protein [Candidatus Saccharimonadales bacterium]